MTEKIPLSPLGDTVTVLSTRLDRKSFAYSKRNPNWVENAHSVHVAEQGSVKYLLLTVVRWSCSSVILDTALLSGQR